MKLTDENYNDSAREVQRYNFANEISEFLTHSIFKSHENKEVEIQLSTCTMDTKEVDNDSFQIVLNVNYVRDC